MVKQYASARMAVGITKVERNQTNKQANKARKEENKTKKGRKE